MAGRDALYEWQTPAEMLVHAEVLRDRLGWESLKRVGRDFREAYVAAKFSNHRNGALVRLLKARDVAPTPDFAIVIDRAEYWFETTEVDRPGRRRGDEPPLWGTQMVHADHWISPEAYFDEVAKRVRTKAKKNYDKCEGLVIWSNAFPIERDHELDVH